MRPAKAKLRARTVTVYSVPCGRCGRDVQVAKKDTVLLPGGKRVAVVKSAVCGACAAGRT